MRHRALITSAALAAVALLAGVVTAWTVFGQHQGGPGSRLAGRRTTATRRAGPAPRGRAGPAPTPPVPAPGGAASVVTMAPGMSQAPDAAQVDGFLVSYFTAINAHNYQQYVRLLIPARRTQLSAADFARGYGTTTDEGASIVGISPTGHGVAATVSFTSQQRVAPRHRRHQLHVLGHHPVLAETGRHPDDRQPAACLPRLSPPLLLSASAGTAGHATCRPAREAGGHERHTARRDGAARRAPVQPGQPLSSAPPARKRGQ